MLRQVALLAAVPLVLAACNSITGTQPGNVPSEEKVCLDDLRAVRITSPGDSPICPGLCLIAWEIDHVCGNYTTEVLVSLDLGRTWANYYYEPGTLSVAMTVLREFAGRTILVKVIIRDPIGQLEDQKSIHVRVNAQRRIRPDQQRD